MTSLLTRRPRSYALAAALLGGTILCGGGASADSGPLSLPPVVNQAGFSDLVTKVKPAVVNIATTEISRQTNGEALPDFPQDSPIAGRPPNMPSARDSSSTPPAISSPTTMSSMAPTRSRLPWMMAAATRPRWSAAMRKPISRC
jgi:S1-C subfamily serine protease